eukprot:TRINITY_DN10139_c0_g1_i2.p1 TRINITY_DN10139_c0_g1~~TRINITY_DN10139_c0_g1_i2.p1  ORF type:complete len:216 (-),score=51.24 TRINITY_DN10139_c0_g1_i2:186-833(-)
MGGDEKAVLYTYWRSSCSWRVRIALQYAGLEVEYRPVHLVRDGGEQLKTEYSGTNPMQQVPTFVMNGNRITQSMAIMEYINEIKPSANLLPKDPATRAKVRMICEIINSGIQPIQNLSVMKMYSQIQEVKMAWSKFWIDKGFQALEKELEKTAGSRCVGDEVSLADCCLVPQVYNANRFSVDMSKYPVISRINANLEKLAQFQAAHPSQQVDCPE